MCSAALHRLPPLPPTMQAAQCTAYGPPETVRLVEVPRPSPRADEVLVRIHASTVASGDWRLRSGSIPRGFKLLTRVLFGFRRLRQPILGTEFSGTIVAAGSSVEYFQPGDEVVGFPGTKMRCHAEYRTMPAGGALVRKPAGLSHAEAAALCFGGTTALHFLADRARLQVGQSILILGGSGAVGSAAIQIARHLGAVVSATSSAVNLPLLRELGATQAFDYRKHDYARAGPRYDVIMDTVGTSDFSSACPALAPGGRFLAVAGDLPATLRGLRRGPQGQRQLAGPASERPENVVRLAELAHQGHYRPVIDQCFPFADIVAAHARVETGRKRGNVVVLMVP